MSREWKPGDVAIWDHGDAGRTDVIFRFLGGDDYDMPQWQTDTDGCGYPVDAQLRRAVVIDPENREQIDSLCKSLVESMHRAGDLASAANGVHPDTVAAALRSLIAPPKPEEPQGLGAVVEDADGVRWTRYDPRADETFRWISEKGAEDPWSDIAAVRILSGGVA